MSCNEEAGLSIRSLLSEQRVVVHGGRRFVCRPPSCRTVILALSYFSVQLLGACLTFRKNPGVFAGLSRDKAAWLVLREIDGGAVQHLAAVLASCCEMHGGAPGELEELLAAPGGRDLAVALVAGVLETCDLERLVAACELDKRVEELEADAPLPDAAEAEAGPLPMEIIATRLAERFGQAPHQVMGWPYQEVIDLCESILPAIAKADRPRGEETFGMSADEWEEEGVTLTTH